MAVWNVGPYDNDHAVDWGASLEATPPEDRARLVEATLEEAVRSGAGLTEETASHAVAAAATVLHAATGVQSSTSAYAPRLASHDGILSTPALRALAIQALDVVTRDGSAWRLGWADDVEEDEALEVITNLRLRLASIDQTA
jgi:hypothetical protein